MKPIEQRLFLLISDLDYNSLLLDDDHPDKVVFNHQRNEICRLIPQTEDKHLLGLLMTRVSMTSPSCDLSAWLYDKLAMRKLELHRRDDSLEVYRD